MVKPRDMSDKPLEKTNLPSGYNLTDELVSVVATLGKNSHTFTVHKNHLAQKCPFAATKLSDKWSVPGNQTLELLDTDPKLAGVFVNWVYREKIDVNDELQSPRPESWTALFDLYMLGESLGSIDFRNEVAAVISEKYMVNKFMDWWPSHYVEAIYKGTAPGSMLRKLIVDFHVYVGRLRPIKQETPMDPTTEREFLQDVVAEVFKSDILMEFSFEKRTFWDKGCDRYLIGEKKVIGQDCLERSSTAPKPSFRKLMFPGKAY